MGAKDGPTLPPILLIEDDPVLRDAVQQFLEANGYTVVGASNGQEALRRLRDGLRPALILLDLRMPVMDGATFRMEQIRDAALRSLPVVVLSADGAARGNALFDGLPQYRKPLDGEELLAIVARCAKPSPPASQSVDDVRIEVRRDTPSRAIGHREVKGRPLLRDRPGLR